MTHCPQCRSFVDDWNKLIKSITEIYGNDTVEFIKVDKDKLPEIKLKY